VSFADPLWLLALALIPLALLAQHLMRRRSRAYAVRFTAVSTLREAIVVRSGWRRYLPLVALLAALAFSAAALARPRIAHRTPIRDASLMLVLDHSGSMAATDVQPTRLDAAIRAANSFIDQVPSSIKVGAVGFSTTPDTIQSPVLNHAAARNVIDNQQADGGTDTGPALQEALQLLGAGKRGHEPAAIVLLSDGAANIGVNPVIVADQARRDGVAIYTVALGTPNGTISQGPFMPPVSVPPDPQLMDQIARASGGRSFDAQTADDLSSIYKALGRKLSTVSHPRDVTVYAIIIAGVLLLIAVAGAVRTEAPLP
jgi:Ca-activated chloride channel family protein